MTKPKPTQGSPWINEVVIDIPAKTITLSSWGEVVASYPVERTMVNIAVRGYDPVVGLPKVADRPPDYYDFPTGAAPKK